MSKGKKKEKKMQAESKEAVSVVNCPWLVMRHANPEGEVEVCSYHETCTDAIDEAKSLAVNHCPDVYYVAGITQKISADVAFDVQDI